MKMTLAEMLEVIEHVENATCFRGQLTILYTKNGVLYYAENKPYTERWNFAHIPHSEIVEVTFKDYDLEVQDILEKQHELDRWIQKRIEK